MLSAELLKKYFSQKFRESFINEKILDGDLQGHIFAPVIWELFALGINEVIVDRSDFKKHNIVRLQFKWRHPSQQTDKIRNITLKGNTDITTIRNGGRKIDVYMEKAMNTRSIKWGASVTYRMDISRALNAGGVILNEEPDYDDPVLPLPDFLSTLELGERVLYEPIDKDDSIKEYEAQGCVFGYRPVVMFRKIKPSL